MPDLVFLVSTASMQCVVEMFARCLFEAWLETGATGQLVPLLESSLASAKLRNGDVLVLNLPLVAWKKSLFLPFLALLLAKLRGRQTLAILHEWNDLAWQRRFVFSTYLLLIDMVMFSSPTVAEQFATRRIRLRNPRNAGIVPIPPNLKLPAQIGETALSRHIADKSIGRIVLGQFGSIYPKKNTTLVLDIAAELKRRGHKPLVVFAGSFIKGGDRIEEIFNEKIRSLDLQKDVLVSGYLDTSEDIFAVLGKMDALVYSFDEGLTARRSSVLAGLQSGRPVIVNAPSRSDEFDHHPVFRHALAENMLNLVPLRASIADYADAVEAAIGRRRQPTDLFQTGWRDAAQALASAIASGAARNAETARTTSASPA